MSSHEKNESRYPLDTKPFHTVIFESDHPFYRLSALGVSDDIVFPVYRYMKKIYADIFFSSGKLRLNTLNSYHDVENLGSFMGDEFEGFRHFHSFIEGDLTGDFEKIPAVFYADTINAWTLCTTKSRNERFYPEFESGCCLKINSVNFFLEIARACTNRWESGNLVSIQYLQVAEMVNNFFRNGKVPMVSHTKGRFYEWQEEVRLILEPWSPASLNEKLDEDVQIALLQNNPRKHLQRARLFPNLEPLTVYAQNARQYAEIAEFR